MRKKFQLGKDVLSLTIFTLITVLTWVSFEVWTSATKNTIPKTTQEQMAPLNPEISQEIFASLKTKISLPEEELNKTGIDNPIASTSANLKEENEVATESSQKATESGILE